MFSASSTTTPISAGAGADRDLVTAGALLHDIGKLEAYTWDTGFAVTEAGALLGHVALGMLMLARRLARATVCADREIWILQHLIASHHGKLEFGAAVQPMTLEAEVLHYADDASAKTASMAEALADPENFMVGELVSLRALWQIDRRKAYRGGSDWDPEGDEGLENENGRLVVARRPSHDWTNQGRGVAAAVLLPLATGWLIRRSGGRG